MSENVREIFAKKLNYFLNLNEKTQKDLADYMKVSSSTASEWCSGTKMPRLDKIQAICNWFDLELSDLLTDNAEKQEKEYYLNNETKKIAQEIFDNKELRILFDASRKASPEDLKLAQEILLRFKKNQGYEE